MKLYKILPFLNNFKNMEKVTVKPQQITVKPQKFPNMTFVMRWLLLSLYV